METATLPPTACASTWASSDFLLSYGAPDIPKSGFLETLPEPPFFAFGAGWRR